ncbi:protein Shroom isoform X2 [Planococcus citri]|uniref:protein Shroom isoform X2 n=1 Tax=Planococcus citri TaxID=170843 RepID=UPI0031F7E2EB
MFAEVFKKDSMQDEEYAECYVFDKTMLLSKTDLESYSTCDYDENIIRNFHQKQSSYAQSEGYHSYVSSNDSAIIAQFNDRSQLENDIIVSADENLCSLKDCGGSGGGGSGDCRSSIDSTGKLHNPYNSCNVKGASYERCNAQHIAHSARVQTPQRHYSESVQYLSTNPGPGSGIGPPAMTTKAYYQPSSSNERSDQKHGTAINSQLRKLYPVNTYCIQPNSCPSVATSYSKACELTSSNASKLPGCSKKSFFESESMQCTTRQNDHSGGRSAAEYTFLDPSKQRIVSNQNLKVIQKQALISYYERHHSTWRSEPQLSTNSSSMSVAQSRPRMPSPTSCHSLCSAQNKDCCDTDKNSVASGISAYKSDNLALDYPASVIGNIPESGSYINNRWKPATAAMTKSTPSSQIGIPFDEERAPELPPKKNQLSLQTSARRLSSPDLPPPSPPPLLDDEMYIPDEPFPPPPIVACEEAAAFICDSSNKPDEPISVPFSDIPSRCTPTKIDSKLRTRTRTNSMYESSTSTTSKFSKSSRSLVPDADRSGPQQPVECVGRRVASVVKSIDDGKTNCSMARKTTNVSRFSSSSFRTYKRSCSDSMAGAEKFPNKMNPQPTTSSAAFCDNAHRAKLPSQAKNDALPHATNHIEQKVKAIRTLFEDKLKKSNFQFPSFSFIHSEKFPSKLDPRFPRTSYQLSQSSNHREFRDGEKGEIFNAVGIYKRTTSPMRSVNDFDNVKSRVALDDSQAHSHQIRTQSPPYLKRSPISESLPPVINSPIEESPLLDIVDKSPPCYRAIPSMITDTSPTLTSSPPLPSPVSPITEEDKILTAFRVSSNIEIDDANDTHTALGHYLIQSSPQDNIEQTHMMMGDFRPVQIPIPATVSPSLHSRSQSISPSELFTMTNDPSNDTPTHLRLHEDTISCLDDDDDDDDAESIHREDDCSRVVAIPALVAEDLSPDASPKNNAVTIDAASQTDVANLPLTPTPAVALPSTSRNTVPSIFENEIEKLRIEVMDGLTPGNRLYKILVPKSNSKTSTDYLENIFEPDVILPATMMQKNLSNVRQSQDTRLQEGSIAYSECAFQLPQEMNTKLNISENCDNFQNMTRCISNTMVGTTGTTVSTSVGILQEKKNTLVKHLTRQLEMLKSELDAISQESRQNEELGAMIWQQIMQSLSAREASKYKLHFQEVGQITSLLLGLGARLAKVENSLQDSSQQDSQTEKKILENRRSQLMQQLEDAKELKNDIDKRSSLLTSLLHKYFNQQQLNQYHQFIQTKCQLLIYNRNLNDKIFAIEQQVNALKEDQIQPYSNATYSCNK